MDKSGIEVFIPLIIMYLGLYIISILNIYKFNDSRSGIAIKKSSYFALLGFVLASILGSVTQKIQIPYDPALFLWIINLAILILWAYYFIVDNVSELKRLKEDLIGKDLKKIEQYIRDSISNGICEYVKKCAPVNRDDILAGLGNELLSYEMNKLLPVPEKFIKWKYITKIFKHVIKCNGIYEALKEFISMDGLKELYKKIVNEELDELLERGKIRPSYNETTNNNLPSKLDRPFDDESIRKALAINNDEDIKLITIKDDENPIINNEKNNELVVHIVRSEKFTYHAYSCQEIPSDNSRKFFGLIPIHHTSYVYNFYDIKYTARN